MYIFQHNGQLSIEEFHAPFGDMLDPNNRWVALASIIPWEPLESRYAPFSAPLLVHRPSHSGWPLVRCISSSGLA
jgi:IS5 family transposase